MSRTTDALLFAVLLVCFAIWLSVAFDSLTLVSTLFAAAGLVVGVFALAGTVLFGADAE